MGVNALSLTASPIFTIKVDIVTGTWIFFEGYNDEGTVNAYLYTENLTFSDTENSYPTIMPEEIRLKINEGYTITSESEKQLIQWETEQNIQPTADIMTEEVLYRAPESMPEPFAKGTEIPFAYQHPCHARFENLRPELEAIVSAEELAQWRKSRRLTMDTHSLHDYCNLYSFICDFELSREQVQTAMKDYIAAWDYDVSLRQDELDAILSGNMSAMLTDFNEPYSGTLVVGDQIYTREWCYYHTIDDYADAGISPQQLYDNWQQITEEMTQEAKDQFYMKVMAYMQQYT